MEPDIHRLAPGEWVQLEYALVGEPGQSGRPTGSSVRGQGDSLSVSAWDTRRPGPETESRFAGRSLPPLPGDGGVQWFHEAERVTPAFARPSTERATRDTQVGFEMVNNSHGRLQCGHWDLYKLVGGEWFHIAPGVHTADCRILNRAAGTSGASGRSTGGSRVQHRRLHAAGLTRATSAAANTHRAGYGHATTESGALVDWLATALR